MPIIPISLDSALGPAALPGSLDALAVGESIFSGIPLPEVPVVEGYSETVFLAQGGLGRVWRARRNADGVAVALKIPHHPDPETAERLVAEAETLRRLDHPNIVRFFELTEDADGAPVIVMELVDGPSLTGQLPDTGFEFDHALQLLLPILDAVAYAHTQGVVHRDLKPSNILLAADGSPKVSDFGLALSLKDRQVAFSLTRCGIVAGTVEYLAPECYEPDSKPTAEADIFALGVILYEILAGRPPRGAWKPLSETKHLDVRLDKLVADAIHPEPAQRLASAHQFRRRLEEIRDTQPRYAGTPLVTRAIRLTDWVWTITGLFCLVAGFCSLQAINNTAVPAIFDLRFGHTHLLGGFWALWVLTILMGAVWGWQTTRLWRFRGVPLREALPSPFGLQLGASKGAALMVAIAQLVCGWAPLLYMAWIYSQVWFWAGPETASWERVLAVTRWGRDETPVSPWTWDPAGMFSSDEFWIREMRPGFVDKTWYLLDRQSFLVVTQPLIMALGAAGIGVGVVTTVFLAALSWWKQKPLLLTAFLALLVATGFSLTGSVREERRDREGLKGGIDLVVRRRTDEARLRRWMPFAWELFNSTYRDPQKEFRFSSELFATVVSLGPSRSITREAFLEELKSERQAAMAEHRVVTAVRESLAQGAEELVQQQFLFESYSDPLDARSVGCFLSVLIEGQWMAQQEPPFLVTQWTTDRQLLYEAEPGSLTPSEAQTWLDALLRCLAANACPDLENFFLPIILSPVTKRIPEVFSEGDYPTPASRIIEELRATRAAWRELFLSSEAPPSVLRLSGARWELDCSVRQSGLRRSGRQEVGRSLAWKLEIVSTDGRWKILRLRI